MKGIEPKAREIAKDLARRSGMTLGEWLNTMILEDGDDDDGVVPLARRPHVSDTYERRGRSRRLDDAYGSGDEGWQRLGASIDAIAARLEAAERRSTVAIQGVDQAVSGLVRRLDGQDATGKTYARRIDDIAEELREGHRRLRKFEQEVGPQTADAFGKIEASVGAITGRLYDIEERQRAGTEDLRRRMEAIEKAAGPGVGTDLLAQVGARLDEAQARTTEALRGLERSFAGLDQRMRAAEGRVEPEGAREAARFEKLAETLTRQVEASRSEMMRRLDTAETEGRIDRIERAVQAIGDQVKASEERAARAVEAMGREVLKIAQNLNGRVEAVETEGAGRLDRIVEAASQAATRKVEAEMGELSHALTQTLTQSLDQRVERRLTASDDRHALALETLGSEITRISDRLSERIAQSERRSAQALDDIGQRLSESSGRIEQRYDRASGELAERMRQSEERTAALLSEARDTLLRRVEPKPAVAAPVYQAEPDWRTAAYPGASFPDAAFPDSDFGKADFGGVESPFADPMFEDAAPAAQTAWTDDVVEAEVPASIAAEPEFDELVAPTTGAAAAMVSDDLLDAVLHGPLSQDRDEALETEADQVAEAEPPVVPTFESAPAPRPASTPFGQGFGGADVSDALAATAPDILDDDVDDFGTDFDAGTEFVSDRTVRSSDTRQTIDAARAAMAPAESDAPRSAFGLKRGGKSRLQERMDKQSGGTVRKALGASALAATLTVAGVVAYGQMTGNGIAIPGLDRFAGGGETVTPTAALAMTPAAPSEADLARGEALYGEAIAKLDADDTTGVETLKQAADLGYGQAQLHLAGLYQDGGKGVDVNPVEARRWAKRAAESGDPRGMHAYGMYLYEGLGGNQDGPGALNWLTRAAEKGLVDSQYNVAKLYETGEQGIGQDLSQAYKWYLIAARAGDGDAQAAVERLRTAVPIELRGQARAEAEKFQVEPLS
ncbi:hypothetical protein [uncultured Brevundimonas sp.]|uniref:SEL1-like repeat protein n=1 Tax=uncultured Brevundimonas sp. TaxID=213418 RepID=UPI0025F1D12B|nr:hypothetical protein [uncultured Brevundimonas sp.]